MATVQLHRAGMHRPHHSAYTWDRKWAHVGVGDKLFRIPENYIVLGYSKLKHTR
jgi:hypothetical protein